MTTPLSALQASHQRLLKITQPLTGDQLRQRGYPAEWSVAQVLSHLGSGAEIGLMALEAGLAGPEPVDRERYQPIWDRWNAKTPDQQAADAIDADARLVDAYTTNAQSTAVFPMWSGPTDIAGVVAGRLTEHAIHTWDIEVVLDRAATIPADAAGVIVDRLGLVAGSSAKPGAWSGLVHVTTTDMPREFALTLGEKSTLDSWLGGDATAELTLPADALIRLVYGRLDPDHTPAVSASGITLDDLRATFRGI